MARILLIEDEVEFRSILAVELERAGHFVHAVGLGAGAPALVGGHACRVVLLDLRLPDRPGMEVLRDLRAMSRPPEVIVMTAHGSIDAAVDAMRAGAYDFLTKPARTAIVLQAIRRAEERDALVDQVTRLRSGDTDADDWIAISPGMRALDAKLSRAAVADAPVLITGETGTGKEVVARRLHALGAGAGTRPFVAVNCAALPESLLASELFGSAKGAFTGAGQARGGLVAAAEGGTLFLDEITEMAVSLQATLLRFVQFGEVRPIGSSESRIVATRLLAATNRDPREAVRAGNLREDLYHRLNVLPLHVPPLRERTDDIPAFCARQLTRRGERADVLLPEALDVLRAAPWPGNVRELESILDRLLLLDGIRPIDAARVSRALQGSGVDAGTGGLRSLVDVERAHIAAVLQSVGGHRKEAAARLGISERTLYTRIAEYGL